MSLNILLGFTSGQARVKDKRRRNFKQENFDHVKCNNDKKKKKKKRTIWKNNLNKYLQAINETNQEKVYSQSLFLVSLFHFIF